MRLQEHIGDEHFVLQLRMVTHVARVLVRSDVKPRPTVESALRDSRDVIGREVIAELIALVDGCPEIAGPGIDGEANRIANAGGVDLFALSVGIENEDVGAPPFPETIVDV